VHLTQANRPVRLIRALTAGERTSRLVDMWQFLYQLVLLLVYPLVRLRLVWRARTEPEYAQRVEERFGRIDDSIREGPVWFHTVSAGETIAAAPLIETLADQFAHLPFLVTTMTPTGSHQVLTRLGAKVDHCYAPYDFPWGVERFFNRVQPRLLVLMETELWPNLISQAKRRSVPVLLVNARLSERSARGYGRISGLTEPMLKSISTIACQFPDHVQRFIEIGADPDTVDAYGSVKFDIDIPTDFTKRKADLIQAWQLDGRHVWIAGSTHPGEDEKVIDAHKKVLEHHADACMILVPRHPVRCDDVEQLVLQAGLSVARLSQNVGEHVDVVLCDTMGQLTYLYGLSEVAFLGGSFAEIGGHNPIEAAICEQPMLMGPHVFNFEEVVQAFVESGALMLVQDANTLAVQLISLLENESGRDEKAQAALAVVNANRGATQRVLDLLAGWITRTGSQ
jgi:3-deoxy-D-manno-octulosonic-acid transferase